MRKATYIERFADSNRISIAEAAKHEILKEYYREYPEEWEEDKKMVPTKPTLYIQSNIGLHEWCYACQTCGEWQKVEKLPDECQHCGQILDWENQEDRKKVMKLRPIKMEYLFMYSCNNGKYSVRCPSCRSKFVEDKTLKNCPACGQLIDWEISEEAKNAINIL